MENTRRRALKNLTLGAAGAFVLENCLASSPTLSSSLPKENKTASTSFRHSVCRWCFSQIPLEELCEHVKTMGITSIELTSPDEWKILQRYGLTAAVGNDKWVSLTEGWNQPALHEDLTKKYIALVDKAAENGIPNIIVFSGNRKGISDLAGLENCAVGLNKLAKHAEQKGVMIVMELLNSKVNHPDYQCDHTPWGVALVDKIASTNFKLLFDIYHMQIMEGDIISTIIKYKDYIAHFHTAGVPGRNEIDETQELFYPAIMRAIAENGFKGYVAQEFIPKSEDKMAALRKGIEICSV